MLNGKQSKVLPAINGSSALLLPVARDLRHALPRVLQRSRSCATIRS